MPRRPRCFVCDSEKVKVRKTFDEACTFKETRECTCKMCGAVWFWDYPERKPC